MQYLRKLNIFQVYRRLPCIIYKQTYLIPQQPFPALYAESAKEMALDPAKVSKGRAQKAVKEDIVYQQQMLEYKNKYILPIGQVKKKASIAIKFFLEEHGDEPSVLYDNKPIKSLIVGQITKVYKSLPQQVRDSYEKRAEVIYSQMKKQKDEYDAKHKIPELTKMTNVQYYKSQMKLLVDKKSIPKFSSLSKKDQKTFIKECQLINQKSNEQLAKFLAQHSLSLKEFTAIAEICEATERCAVLLKKFKEIQKKKIEYLSKVTKNDGETPDFNIFKGVQEQLKKHLKLLEGLSETKLHVIAKIIGFKVENEQMESKDVSSQTKVQEKDKLQVKADNEKKIEQKLIEKEEIKPIEKEEIKVELSQTKQETKAVPDKQKVQEKKPEPQSPIIQEKKEQKEQKSQQPSNDKKTAQPKVDFSNQSSTQNEYSDVLQDLKDENLNDLNIIDDDYEVLKINELMEKARQLKLSKHDVKS